MSASTFKLGHTHVTIDGGLPVDLCRLELDFLEVERALNLIARDAARTGQPLFCPRERRRPGDGGATITTKAPRRYYAVCWRYGKGCYSEQIANWRVIATPIREVYYFGSRSERDECLSTADNPYDPGAPWYWEPIKRRELQQAELRRLHGY